MAYTFNPFTANFDYYQPSGTGGTTFYTELLSDSGDHQNFTSAHTINAIMSLMDGSGKGIPSNLYSIAGSTVTLTSADANIASLGIYIVYE